MPTPATAPSTPSERRNDTIQTQGPSTQTTCPTSTCCAEDSLAKHFLSLAAGGALPTPEALCSLRSPAWLKPDGLHICSLKTFPAFCHITKARRLRPSSPRWMSWGIMSSGLCLTQNILESRNPGSGCSLSDILIPDAPGKYFLSSEQVEKLLYKSSVDTRGSGSTTQKG